MWTSHRRGLTTRGCRLAKCLECERAAKVRGYCQAHYNRAARRGLLEKKPKRLALCHPERKHYAYDYCRSCYLKNRPETPRERTPVDSQPGLVRIEVSGWGFRRHRLKNPHSMTGSANDRAFSADDQYHSGRGAGSNANAVAVSSKEFCFGQKKAPAGRRTARGSDRGPLLRSDLCAYF